MQKWQLKALVQGAFSLMPMRTSLNYLAQRYITKSLVANPRGLSMRLKWTGQHLAYFQDVTGRELPRHVLELGTGWFPTVPLAMWLCGVDTITTVDIVRLLKPSYFNAQFKLFAGFSVDDMRELLPLLKVERYHALRAAAAAIDTMSIDAVMRRFAITPMIADARKMPSTDQSFDCIVSNTTLEHIPEPILTGIWKEFRRVISADGVMSHLADMSDHYAHFDSSINGYNYLRYDEREWRLYNNALLYQNRLRLPDYRRLHVDTRFTIVKEINNVQHAEKLASVPIAKPFQKYSREELIPTSTWMVSVPD